MKIDSLIGITSALCMFSSQTLYIRDVIRKKVRPSLLSWFGWSLLMGISMLSQILEKGMQFSQIGIIASTLGCFLIAVIGLVVKNYSIKKIDWLILSLGMICLMLYLYSSNAFLTTIYAIVADFIIAIPTLIKVFINPLSEKTNGWYLSLIAWTLALSISINQDILFILFPVYLFSFSLLMTVMMNLPQRQKLSSNT